MAKLNIQKIEKIDLEKAVEKWEDDRGIRIGAFIDLETKVNEMIEQQNKIIDYLNNHLF